MRRWKMAKNGCVVEAKETQRDSYDGPLQDERIPRLTAVVEHSQQWEDKC